MNHTAFAILLHAIIAFPLYADAQGTIQLFYDERVPYAAATEKGTVEGLTASPAAKAFDAANVAFKWKKMPFKRQLETIKFNKKKACGIGWFKNKDREQFALYSAPIYQDNPTVTLSRSNNDRVNKHKNSAELIGDKEVKLLVKDSFSYGTFIDNLIAEKEPQKIVVVGSTNLQMLQAIYAGRADYFFIAEEEAQTLIEKSGLQSSVINIGRYEDMPRGNNRYIACSKSVSRETVDLLNINLKQ